MDTIPRLAKVLRLYPNKTIQSRYRSAVFPPFPLMAYYRAGINDFNKQNHTIAIPECCLSPFPLMAYYILLMTSTYST